MVMMRPNSPQKPPGPLVSMSRATWSPSSKTLAAVERAGPPSGVTQTITFVLSPPSDIDLRTTSARISFVSAPTRTWERMCEKTVSCRWQVPRMSSASSSLLMAFNLSKRSVASSNPAPGRWVVRCWKKAADIRLVPTRPIRQPLKGANSSTTFSACRRALASVGSIGDSTRFLTPGAVAGDSSSDIGPWDIVVIPSSTGKITVTV